MTTKTLRSGKSAAKTPIFWVDASRGFESWLSSKKSSLAVTTYQAGKVLLFGVDPHAKEGASKLWVFNRNIGRCLGLATDEDGGGFWVTSDTQLHRFSDVTVGNDPGPDGIDALYAPRFSFVTGDLDAHDVAVEASGRVLFANTLFNSVATPSRDYSFETVWQPDFISRLAAEDRCHLNGLALRDGKLAYVTTVSRTDIFGGWREHRTSGGLVIDVQSGETVCTGLSMPHSPRWHNGKLWLLNSGTGEFGYVDFDKGKFEPLAFCPGYLRGLSFIDDYTAAVGLSLPRDNKTFSGLPLDDRLREAGVSPRCGICFIDTRTGDVIHSLTFEGKVTELYDVAVLKGRTKPAMLGPNTEEIKRTLSLSPDIS